MAIKKIYVSPLFERQYKKLPQRIKEYALVKEKLFRINPFSPQLRVHKLHEKEKEIWTFSIQYSYRIKFIFLTDEEVLFLEIGTHEVYQ
ncbi:MAG: type II toxin-antitoxin system mRNA interferase toxin, RelE/StbE family [Parcubacteria group bacterium]|nr:type II toxin-antitoxin system mRNA interferase toxin, RelE/StbE family [Parcubacteria group bacterium]